MELTLICLGVIISKNFTEDKLTMCRYLPPTFHGPALSVGVIFHEN